MGFDQGLYNPPNGGGSFPPSPPSPVLRGNTIFVSKTGSAGGARQDVTYHYNTIADAVAVAQDGDIIIVYPGEYIETITFDSSVSRDLYSIHLMKGAIWTDNTNCIYVSGKTVRITGNGTIVATADGIAAAVFDGFLDIECDELYCEDGIAFYCSGATSVSYIKCNLLQTTNNGTPLVYEDGECYVTASYIGDSATDNSRSVPSGNYNAAIVTVGTVTGKLIVNADRIRTRAYGYTIFNSGVKYIEINASEIVNDYTGAVGTFDELAAVIADNAVQNGFCCWNANVFGYGGINGYYMKSINEVIAGFNSIHRFNGTIQVEAAASIWANGNFDISLYMNGLFINETDEVPNVMLGGGSGEWANSWLKFFITGKILNLVGGVGIQYNSIGTLRANLSKLVVDAIIALATNTGFSIQGDDSDVPLDVIIYRLISNVSSDPSTINETVVQSVVDPTVI